MICARCGGAAPTTIKVNVGHRPATMVNCDRCGALTWEVAGKAVSRHELFGVAPAGERSTAGRRRNRSARS
jgi:hypothetical protein